MKKIKHKPDFEPFALVIETEAEMQDLVQLLDMVIHYFRPDGPATLTAKKYKALIDDPCDE